MRPAHSGVVRSVFASAGVVVAGANGIAQEWRPLPTAPTTWRIDDVFFIDERSGWTAASGQVYRTLDGGDSWQSFDVPGLSMRSITFSSPGRGWIGSLNSTTPLWASVDSGATWQAVDLPEPRPLGICGLWSVNETVVYGCGRYYAPRPTVIKTTNSGSTWTTIDMSSLVSGLVDCFFWSPDSGLVVGRASDAIVERILFTGDGGATWSIRYTGVRPDSWCWKISFPTRRVGYVSVETTGADTHCLKTMDGGETWFEVLAPGAYNMQGIGFATESLGWISHSRLLRTADGGATWSPEAIGTRINRIRFLRPELGYAAGATIYKYSAVTPVRPQSITQVKTRYRSN